MTLVLQASLVVLLGCAALAGLRVVTGRTLVDRAVAFDLVLALAINGLAIGVLLRPTWRAEDVILVATLLGVVGTLAVAPVRGTERLMIASVWTSVVDGLVIVAAVIGAMFAVSATLGVFRLRDAYGRMHAASKPATLSAVCFLGAAALRADDPAVSTKLIVALVLQLVVGPIGAHLLGIAARQSGVELVSPDQAAPSDAATRASNASTSRGDSTR
ncbi:MAG: monovalent cation/H(+) antiporter subunit G [Ilumatobacteraceae bacterium]